MFRLFEYANIKIAVFCGPETFWLQVIHNGIVMKQWEIIHAEFPELCPHCGKPIGDNRCGEDIPPHLPRPT